VALCLDRLVGEGVIDLRRLVELLSTNPARILGLPGGTLEVGAPADLTLLDLRRKRKVDPARFESKGRSTPFAGLTLKGWPVTTIVGGRVVWQDRR
jgi:dihydroorotase